MSAKDGIQTDSIENESDWNADIKLQSGLTKLRSLGLPNLSGGIVIALTGASGFVGRKLLPKLAQVPQITKIYCIAVRNPESIAKISSSSKIVVHAGDLKSPNLGMTNEASQQVFGTTDVVIHNGAKVAFSKPYEDMRDENVGSTRELVRLSLEYNHVSHLQFISTSGLATVLSRDIYEEQACSTPPESPNAQGYIFTKLACELYLEEVSRTTGLCVTIHRPTIVIGPDAPRLDVMHSVLHYSTKISAVPELTAIDGTLQFVEVDRVAEDIVSEVTRDPERGPRVKYRNNYDENVEVHELGSFVSKRSGIDVSTISVNEWIPKAETAGLAPDISKFLGAVQFRGQNIKLHRLWKGTQQ